MKKKKMSKKENTTKDIHDLFTKPIDPKVLEDAEKMRKRLSYISVEELHRPFTI